MKQEHARSLRLDGKLRQVIKTAKKRLVKSPSAKKAFKKICEDLNYVKEAESETEGEWDFKREMQSFKAN